MMPYREKPKETEQNIADKWVEEAIDAAKQARRWNELSLSSKRKEASSQLLKVFSKQKINFKDSFEYALIVKLAASNMIKFLESPRIK